MLYFFQKRTVFIAALALTVGSLHGMAFAVGNPPTYTQDFREGFRKGSNDARAFLERTASDLDRVYNFSKLAVDGQLPPVLRSTEKDAPLVYRCNRAGSFTVIQPTQPLCKEKDARGVCKALVNWRDYLMEGLAPESSSNAITALNKDEFKNGEEAAQSTALDNLDMLNQMYSGMTAYRTLETCKGAPATK